jgi:ribonuclease Z
MTFELTVLGSSSALPTSVKFPTAQVLNVHERFFLIDCGEGTQIQLRKAKIKFGRINHIFISHLHGDHVFGLFGLMSTFNLLGRKTVLHLYGHSDLQKIVDFYLAQFAPNNLFPIEIHPVVKRKIQLIYEDKAIKVFAFPLKHRVPTFGYLFREITGSPNIRKDCIIRYNLAVKQIQEIKKGNDLILESGEIIPNDKLTERPLIPRSYAYCSDTAVYEKIIPWIKDVSLLYHESTFLNTDRKLAKETTHSTALQAATIASRACVDKLLIGHFSSRYKNTDLLQEEARQIFKNTFIAEELQTYQVPLVRENV